MDGRLMLPENNFTFNRNCQNYNKGKNIWMQYIITFNKAGLLIL